LADHLPIRELSLPVDSNSLLSEKYEPHGTQIGKLLDVVTLKELRKLVESA
jgi:hypothetical protein